MCLSILLSRSSVFCWAMKPIKTVDEKFLLGSKLPFGSKVDWETLDKKCATQGFACSFYGRMLLIKDENVPSGWWNLCVLRPYVKFVWKNLEDIVFSSCPVQHFGFEFGNWSNPSRRTRKCDKQILSCFFLLQILNQVVATHQIL